MPYITQERRKMYEPELESMIKRLKGSPKIAGDVAYIITKVMWDSLSPHDFESMALLDGVWHLVTSEYERRVVAPYETEKMKQSGDVYE